MQLKELKEYEILSTLLQELPEGLMCNISISTNLLENEIKQDISIKAEDRLKYEQSQIYLKVNKMTLGLIKDKTQKVKDEFKLFLKSVPFIYNEQDKLMQIDNLEDLESNQQIISPAEKIYIIQFWVTYIYYFFFNKASWSGYCIKYMKQNKNLLETNEQYKQIEYIAISMDDNLEDLKSRILEDNLGEPIKHYRFRDGWQVTNPIIRAFDINSIPLIVVLNKSSIQFIGHPKDFSLDSILQQINKQDEQNEAANIQEQVQIENQLIEEEIFNDYKLKLENEIKNQIQKEGLDSQFYQITLRERFQIKREGDKIIQRPIERTSFILNYDVQINFKDNANNIYNYILELYPDAKIIQGQAVIRDKKADMRTKLYEFLQQKEIQVKFLRIETYNFTYNHETDDFHFQEENDEQVEVILSKGQKITIPEYKQLNEEMTEQIINKCDDYELINYAQNVLDNIRESGVQYKVGEKFHPIKFYFNKLDKEVVLFHKPGFVNLITYLYGHDLEQITQLIKIKNDKKWKDKLKLTFLILTEESNEKELKNSDLIKDSLKDAEILFNKNEMSDNYDDLILYGFQSIPHFIFLHKNGNILDIQGNMSEEEMIEKLDLAIQGKLINQPQKSVNIKKEQFEKAKKFLKSHKVSGQLNKLGDYNQFALNIKLIEIVDDVDDEYVKYNKPEISFFIRQGKQDQLFLFLDKIYKYIPKEYFTVKSEISKILIIPPPKPCVLCKADIAVDSQYYYCPFKQEFLCCYCAEYDDKTQIGLKRYKYTDGVIFINGPLDDPSVLTDIDEYKIGKNLKIGPDEPGSQQPSFSCNGCNDAQVGPRYIALNLRPGQLQSGGYIDLCQGCFESIKQRGTEQAQDIIFRNTHEGMTADVVLYRVLFSHGYYEF